MPVNNRLKLARENAGKTQLEISKEIGVSCAQYQNYEYEENLPNVKTAIKIAKALGCTVEELF